MSFLSKNNLTDILWIETSIPVIASIYYHLHLKQTHSLYCPDDVIDHINHQHVRDLARDILYVIDSNNYKKLALHFIHFISLSKRDDLVRFLLKRRPHLTVSCLTLPVPVIQQFYLSGWSFSLGPKSEPLWYRQCLAPFKETYTPALSLVPSDASHTSQDFLQPFLIASKEFTKKALFVHMTQDMIQFNPTNTTSNSTQTDNLFQITDAALLAIQGWMDAISSLPSEAGNSLILIADESIFFSKTEQLELQEINHEHQNQKLSLRRQQVQHMMESLAYQLPVYLYLSHYNTSRNNTIDNNLAWLQQRHHISIAYSILMTWGPYQQTVEQLDQSVSMPIHLDLTCIAKYDRSRWKTEFVELLRKHAYHPHLEKERYISPDKLNLSSSNEDYVTPMLNLDDHHFISTRMESGETFSHSVSSMNSKVMESWVKVQHITTGESDHDNNGQKNNMKINDSEKTHHDMTGDFTSDASTQEESTLKLEQLVKQITQDRIQNYIANSGAFTRGQGLLHTFSELSCTWNDANDTLLLFAKAKGTSETPYDVHIVLDRKGNERVIRDGKCTCPVGRNGRCKHCAALLLLFMNDSDGFKRNNQGQEQKTTMTTQNISTSKSSPSTTETIPTITSSSVANNTLISTKQHLIENDSARILAAPSRSSPSSTPLEKFSDKETDTITPDIDDSMTSSSPSTTEQHNPTDTATDHDLPPRRRRVLPWAQDPTQKGTKGRKKQRVSKKQSIPSDSFHDPEAKKTSPLSPRTGNNKKKTAHQTDNSEDDDGNDDFEQEFQGDKGTPMRRPRRNTQQKIKLVSNMTGDDLDKMSSMMDDSMDEGKQSQTLENECFNYQKSSLSLVSHHQK
ncbi:uncharacterized protein BX664DRAFT_331421 [Halteromyces radiatus]|uniref:uncharacterized protein n=1 Tax=Halteromyces radiatus TaxID=101107 RepID=UPI00221EB112|nr:uncharacterized protein BX664DRAFT_331421 [Halteromyces radiatus]KAI8088809.1 hypothetical protein BX664DRAFT_331421 [Halteromyces radiatus]